MPPLSGEASFFVALRADGIPLCGRMDQGIHPYADCDHVCAVDRKRSAAARVGHDAHIVPPIRRKLQVERRRGGLVPPASSTSVAHQKTARQDQIALKGR